MQLYEPLLERDVKGIRAAIAEFRASHSQEELFSAIARFAILAFAPSTHAKHAVIACLSAHDVGLTDEIITECAIYAAQARQPWSEPPIPDPPPLDDGAPEGLEDRSSGERWLARRYRNPGFDRELFSAAAEDFADLGHKLIMAVVASRFAGMFPDAARFATLRIAVWEMTAYRGEAYRERGQALETAPLFERLIATMIANDGDIVSAHDVFLLDAALQTGDEDVVRRVRDHLSGGQAILPVPPDPTGRIACPPLRPYQLSRDCGSLLKCHAIATRLRLRFPSVDFDGMLAAAQYNLDNAPSLEDFSFA